MLGSGEPTRPTYDLRGPWDATPGHQGNVYPDPDPARGGGRGLETVVATYVDAGGDPAQPNCGVADYGYDAERREWWPFDDPTAIKAKTRWAVAQVLGGIDHWEVAHDPDAELVRTGAEKLRTLGRGPAARPRHSSCRNPTTSTRGTCVRRARARPPRAGSVERVSYLGRHVDLRLRTTHRTHPPLEVPT